MPLSMDLVKQGINQIRALEHLAQAGKGLFLNLRHTISEAAAELDIDEPTDEVDAVKDALVALRDALDALHVLGAAAVEEHEVDIPEEPDPGIIPLSGGGTGK